MGGGLGMGAGAMGGGLGMGAGAMGGGLSMGGGISGGMGANTNPFATSFGAPVMAQTPASNVAGAPGMRPLIPDNEMMGQRNRQVQPQKPTPSKNPIDIDPFAQFK